MNILSSILKGLFISPKEARAFAEFEEAIANLQKVTGEGYVSSNVLVDELSERFTEEPSEIPGILCRYVLRGGDWADLNRYIFGKPHNWYQGKEISLASYIAAMPTSAPES